PEMLGWRHEIIRRYDEAFKDLPVTLLDHRNEEHQSSGHLYFVKVNNITEEKRNEIIIKMAEKGIACNVHYKPLPMLTAYNDLGFDIENYPNAYDQYKNQITLPLYSKLNKTDIDYIITCFKEILKACGCY
ncbi:DegT/DnrJ/EryC1/StrS family aminotransferase, partial [[Clostridium] innocuum]|nr:DegT/DnrJ/EryC1/StrS family aminotransferase [[Clostridium] innocuum]MCR0415532.1 DegT/DnrJ/EryC1/StrS family aminotransferase [[Clostridium] innocuum]MCR0536734.1 DegT/DnrJ/EryC1/StrS family aminotransferase [[Clostridium] innocuum]MCR0540795.1 DegT/DnrJ/EryC1/StrS family aminotransferase [[Clostridium] innocuum]